MRSDHEQLEDMVAAHLLGAGEPGEVATVRAHLEGCSSCRELAARLGRVVGVLPLAVEESVPPGRLRERILAAAAAEPHTSTAPQPDFSQNRALRLPRVPDFSRNPVRGARWLPMAAAATLLLAAGAAGGVAITRATAPGLAAAHYSLKGTGALPGATASVIDFRSSGTTLVEFRGLPAAPQGKVYQLWMMSTGAKPVSGGVFVPDADGSKVLVIPRDLAGVSVMAVTIEQGPDGAAQPTQQPEVSGSVS